MLREIEKTRQIIGEPRRRWFSEPTMDLIVWCDEDEVVGFQFTYNKPHDEKAVTWRSANPHVHHAGVDDGEQVAGRFKSTPILVATSAWDAWHICGKFLQRSEALPPALRVFVSRTLVQSAGNIPP